MKKALPMITLLCYAVAVAGCIAHIICEVIPSATMLILFIAFVVGILALMSVSTVSVIKNVKELLAAKNEEVAFEGLSLQENTQSKDSPYSDDVSRSVSSVFAEEPVQETDEEAVEEAAEEAVEEAAEEVVEEVAEEAVEEVAEEAVEETVEEVAEDVVEEVAEEVVEETADEAAEDNVEIIVLPIEAADEDDEPDEEDDDDGDDDDDDNDAVITDGDDDSISSRFKESRFRYSYTSKLIQAEDETKSYYSTVKNAFMSYKKVTATVSREHERFRRGRATIGIAKLRGKTIILYLALDPAQLENTMYVGKDVSDTVKYADVPFQYRVNGPRKASRAVRLIAMVAEKFGLEAKSEPANEDYVALYPYETTEALIEKGLIVDKVAEAARKAEEARIAAEEAEKAAEKAIDDAIKAKESATAAAEKAAEKAEIHGEDVEETPNENN